MSLKRINKEFNDIAQNLPEGITISLPPNAHIYTWHVVLSAPEQSPYHPGRFGLLVTLPSDYPFKAPIIKFVTRIYHPNVTNDDLGSICLGILKPENWKPSTKMVGVLEAVRNLLAEPQPDDPLDDKIAEEYKNNRLAWEKTARSFVERYALVEPVFPALPAP